MDTKIVTVLGTSHSSFELVAGATLELRVMGPSSPNRPTLRGRFTKAGYLLFYEDMRVGTLSPQSVSAFRDRLPNTCKVVTVNRSQNVIRVELELK